MPKSDKIATVVVKMTGKPVSAARCNRCGWKGHEAELVRYGVSCPKCGGDEIEVEGRGPEWPMTNVNVGNDSMGPLPEPSAARGGE